MALVCNRLVLVILVLGLDVWRETAASWRPWSCMVRGGCSESVAAVDVSPPCSARRLLWLLARGVGADVGPIMGLQLHRIGRPRHRDVAGLDFQHRARRVRPDCWPTLIEDEQADVVALQEVRTHGVLMADGLARGGARRVYSGEPLSDRGARSRVPRPTLNAEIVAMR